VTKIKAVCTYSLSSLSSSRSEFRKDYHQRVVASGFFIAYPHPYSTRKQRICMDGLEENTALCTPQSKRRPALVKRLVKHLVHRWKQGQMYKRINSSSALGAFLYLSLISVNKSMRMLGAGRIETAIYPPLENLCLKEM